MEVPREKQTTGGATSAPRAAFLSPQSALRLPSARSAGDRFTAVSKRQTGPSAGRADASGPPEAGRPEPASARAPPTAPERFRWPSGPSMSSGGVIVGEVSAKGTSSRISSPKRQYSLSRGANSAPRCMGRPRGGRTPPPAPPHKGEGCATALRARGRSAPPSPPSARGGARALSSISGRARKSSRTWRGSRH